MYKVTVGKDIEMYEMMNSTKKRLLCANSYRVFKKIKYAEDKMCDDFNISPEDIIISTEILSSGVVKITVKITVGKVDYTFFDSSAFYYNYDTEEDFLNSLDKALSNIEYQIDQKLNKLTIFDYLQTLVNEKKIDYWQRVNDVTIYAIKDCYIISLFIPKSITQLTDHIKAEIDKEIINIKSPTNLFAIGNYSNGIIQTFVIKLAKLFGQDPILDLVTIQNPTKREALRLRWEFYNKTTGERIDIVYPSFLYDADVSIKNILEYEYKLAHESFGQDLDDFMND